MASKRIQARAGSCGGLHILCAIAVIEPIDPTTYYLLRGQTTVDQTSSGVAQNPISCHQFEKFG